MAYASSLPDRVHATVGDDQGGRALLTFLPPMCLSLFVSHGFEMRRGVPPTSARVLLRSRAAKRVACRPWESCMSVLLLRPDLGNEAYLREHESVRGVRRGVSSGVVVRS